MKSEQARTDKETSNLIENYIKLELKKDSVFLLEMPARSFSEMCATEILKNNNLDLSVEQLITQTQRDTAMWVKNELPRVDILKYDKRTHSAKAFPGKTIDRKQAYYLLSRPIFSKDYSLAI